MKSHSEKDGRTRPVTVRGQTFETYALAGEHLGVSGAAVSNAVKRGTLDTLGLGAGFEKVKWREPGFRACVGYVRRIMSDGRWRTGEDVTEQALRDGMIWETETIRSALNYLSDRRVLQKDVRSNTRMWRRAK